jgi:hypothetical protein
LRGYAAQFVGIAPELMAQACGGSISDASRPETGKFQQIFQSGGAQNRESVKKLHAIYIWFIYKLQKV